MAFVVMAVGFLASGAMDAIGTAGRAKKSRMIDTLIASESADELLDALTSRQREIARMLNEGYNQQEIAVVLGVSKQCIADTLCNIRQKLVAK